MSLTWLSREPRSIAEKLPTEIILIDERKKQGIQLDYLQVFKLSKEGRQLCFPFESFECRLRRKKGAVHNAALGEIQVKFCQMIIMKDRAYKDLKV